jgi:hypothetical protein
VLHGDAGLAVSAAASVNTYNRSPRFAGCNVNAGAVLVVGPAVTCCAAATVTCDTPDHSSNWQPAVGVAPFNVIVTVCEPADALNPYQISMTPTVPDIDGPRVHNVTPAPETADAANPDVTVAFATLRINVSPPFVTVIACAIDPAVTATFVVTPWTRAGVTSPDIGS